MGAGALRFQTNIDFRRAIELNDEFLMPFARVHERLRERGIEFHPTSGDFIFADSDHGPPPTDRPIVLLDRSDGAFLWWRFQPQGQIVRTILESQDLMGLIKISRYPSRHIYNSEETDSSHHARLIRGSRPAQLPAGSESLIEPISNQAFSRIRLGVGYWAFDQCAPLELDHGFKEARKRPIDVFCAVSVNYVCPTITWHRETAIEQLSRLPGIRTVLGRGRVFPDQQYRELLQRSRICVSPWGWGETCIRDYEALLAGCVLIKPRTDFIESALPLDDRHYVACRPDFADLGERVAEVLDQWPVFAARTPELREYVLRARHPDAIADQYATAIRESVESCAG